MTESVFSLAVPLSRTQVQAAERLHRRLDRWRHTDDALKELAHQFPEFDLVATLLKVSALNQLYGTNLYAVVPMAEHIVEVLAAKPKSGPKLVETIAALPSQARRRHLSFASKFAHFFLDQDEYPIYDAYALRTLRLHLGQATSARAPAYASYVADVRHLRKLAILECSTRELDHYLWLAGLYRDWGRGKRMTNAEFVRLLSSPPDEVIADFQSLMGNSQHST